MIERQFYTCPCHNYYVTDDPHTTCPNITYHIQSSGVEYIDDVSIVCPRMPCPSSVEYTKTVETSKNGRKIMGPSKKNDREATAIPFAMELRAPMWNIWHPLQELRILRLVTDL